jgi:pyruvate dehydrogenase E2 component (dihydrolipoamide acetyltransferase)
MITPVLMPQLGLEVNQGIVNTVLVGIGTVVEQDQPLMELETDKAITEVVAPCGGVVRTIEATQGDTVAVGAVLIRLGDTIEEPLDGPLEVSDPALPAPDKVPSSVADQQEPSISAAEAPRQRVAPVARRAAARLGVDLAALTGTGPRGRITLDDVQGAAGGNGSASTHDQAPPDPVRAAGAPPREGAAAGEPLTATRRAVARRMTASQLIPQYHLEKDIDATHLLAEKESQRSRGNEKVGFNDLLIQAIAETVLRHPPLATAYLDGEGDVQPSLLRSSGVTVGLAVATERGLVVPVIGRAHELGLADIARERQRLVGAARSGRLSLEEMAGGTITLSSLAALGIDRFTAMVNPGESAIVAVGRTVEHLVPRGRSIAIVPTLTLSLSFDHRVVDGAVGAEALAELATLLEGGMTWRP